MPKKVNLGDFLKNWSFGSNSVIIKPTYNRTKIGENPKIEKLKCDILSNFQTLCTWFLHAAGIQTNVNRNRGVNSLDTTYFDSALGVLMCMEDKYFEVVEKSCISFYEFLTQKLNCLQQPQWLHGA